MKTDQLLTLFVAASLTLVAGCRSSGPPSSFSQNPRNYRPTMADNALKVSGPPGTRFTASYQSSRGSGMVTSATKSEPSTVIKTPDGDLQADIRKEDSSLPLTVEISRGDRSVFRTDVPPGKEGVKVEPDGLNWRAELY